MGEVKFLTLKKNPENTKISETKQAFQSLRHLHIVLHKYAPCADCRIPIGVIFKKNFSKDFIQTRTMHTYKCSEEPQQTAKNLFTTHAHDETKGNPKPILQMQRLVLN